MAQQNIKPRFEVEDRTDEVVKVPQMKREDGRNVEHEVEESYGWHVYFPAGHSMRVRTRDELRTLGFDQAPDLIDQDTGDVVGTQQTSLKKLSQRRAGASKRPDAGSVDAKQ